MSFCGKRLHFQSRYVLVYSYGSISARGRVDYIADGRVLSDANPDHELWSICF